MFKYGFAEAKNFLQVCEKTTGSIDNACVICERAILAMTAKGFSGLSADIAEQNFFSWYDSASLNSLSFLLVHALGKEAYADAQVLKYKAEAIPASIGANAKQSMVWDSSEVAVTGDATSLCTQVQGIKDIEIHEMETTLSSMLEKASTATDSGSVIEAINSLTTELTNQKDKLSNLKSSTQAFVDAVSDFESSFSFSSETISEQNSSINFAGLTHAVGPSLGSQLLKTLDTKIGDVAARINGLYAQSILSRVDIIKVDSYKVRAGKYADIYGMQVKPGTGGRVTTCLFEGTESPRGSATLRHFDQLGKTHDIASAFSKGAKILGRGLNVLSVGLSVWDGYNRAPNATEEERVVHAATEGTIAAAGGIFSTAIGFAVAGTSAGPGVGTAVGFVVGAIWTFGTWALGEIKDENGVSAMEHIDNAAYGLYSQYKDAVTNNPYYVPAI